MTATPEQHISRALASHLDRLPVGAAIDVDSNELKDVLAWLERYLQAILRQVYDAMEVGRY